MRSLPQRRIKGVKQTDDDASHLLFSKTDFQSQFSLQTIHIRILSDFLTSQILETFLLDGLFWHKSCHTFCFDMTVSLAQSEI